MTFQQAAYYIESLKPAGMKWGLERMGRILSLCGHPEKRLRVVHVAGTNGKGSTARMIQCILTAAGYRTGLYASPAVTGIRDTVTIDGTAITEETFAALTEKMASLQGEMGEVGSLSEFELTTALAFLNFASQHTGQQCDFFYGMETECLGESTDSLRIMSTVNENQRITAHHFLTAGHGSGTQSLLNILVGYRKTTVG